MRVTNFRATLKHGRAWVSLIQVQCFSSFKWTSGWVARSQQAQVTTKTWPWLRKRSWNATMGKYLQLSHSKLRTTTSKSEKRSCSEAWLSLVFSFSRNLKLPIAIYSNGHFEAHIIIINYLCSDLGMSFRVFFNSPEKSWATSSENLRRCHRDPPFLSFLLSKACAADWIHGQVGLRPWPFGFLFACNNFQGPKHPQDGRKKGHVKMAGWYFLPSISLTSNITIINILVYTWIMLNPWIGDDNLQLWL